MRQIIQVIPFPNAVSRSKFQEPILLDARSKALVGGRSLPGIADSNPAQGKDVCYARCVLSDKGPRDRPIHRPEESYQVCVHVCVHVCVCVCVCVCMCVCVFF